MKKHGKWHYVIDQRKLATRLEEGLDQFFQNDVSELLRNSGEAVCDMELLMFQTMRRSGSWETLLVPRLKRELKDHFFPHGLPGLRKLPGKWEYQKILLPCCRTRQNFQVTRVNEKEDECIAGITNVSFNFKSIVKTYSYLINNLLGTKIQWEERCSMKKKKNFHSRP